MAQSVLELEVENYLIKCLDEKRIFHFKGNPSGLKGYPDRTVLSDREYHVEVKVGKEFGSYYKQTLAQKWWQTKFEHANSVYVLLTGFKEVDDFVNKLPSQI